MKICMMTNTFLPHVGGVAKSVQTFAEDYRRKRHRTLIVAPEFPEDESVPKDIERHVIRLPAVQRFNGSDFSVVLPLATLLNTRLEEFQPQIIHSHHPFLIGDTALRYSVEKNAPIVFTHHTLYEQYTHYVPMDSPALKNFVIELTTEYANMCDAVIAPSESIATLIRERGVETEIEVIPTGVDVQSFSSGDGDAFRKKQGLPGDAFVVGHVGRLAPEKNLDYLGRAASQFAGNCKKAHFLVVGDGPSRENLQGIFTERNLTDRLNTPGRLIGQDLLDAYAAMNVFAFSSFSETQGMVLAEAMAAGLPVVALDASGVREVVRDDKNGFMLDAKAPEEMFADSLKRIQQDGDLLERLRKGARKTAGEFSREASAEKALELYRRVRRQTHKERRANAHNIFGPLLSRIELEWDLVTGKAQAAFTAMGAEDEAEENR
jgi:glycosyltransferase involved in cell wall biosynthesis